MVTFQLPIPQSPICDPRTGIISRDWYLFLNSFYQAAGSSTGGTVTSNDTQLLFSQQRVVPAETSNLSQRISGIESLLLMMRDERSEIETLKKRIEQLEILLLARERSFGATVSANQRVSNGRLDGP
jgi:hypothetical protein